mgnify:FL=1
MNKIIFIDVETGGLDTNTCALTQLSAIVVIDKETKAMFNAYVKPFKNASFSLEALAVQGRKFEDFENINCYDEKDVYEEFIRFLDTYVNKFDKKDKFVVAGYNVAFDLEVLENFFKRNRNYFLYSYFNAYPIDPFHSIRMLQMVGKLPTLENNRLETWCNHFNIKINAHNSLGDIIATKKLITKFLKIIKE